MFTASISLPVDGIKMMTGVTGGGVGRWSNARVRETWPDNNMV